MTTTPKINEMKVLVVLAAHHGACFPFRPLMRRTRLSRTEVRRACRSLRRKGLARYERALWTEDGEMVGAGYGATAAVAEAADPVAVKRYTTKWYDR